MLHLSDYIIMETYPGNLYV